MRTTRIFIFTGGRKTKEYQVIVILATFPHVYNSTLLALVHVEKINNLLLIS